MKKYLLLGIIALATLSVSAQKERNFTVKAGVGLAHVVGSDADTKVNIAARIGAAYDVKLYKGLYLIPEVDFALKGFNPSTNNFFYDTQTAHMVYLQAPVWAAYKFRLKKEGSIVVKAGPYFACGLFGSKLTPSYFFSSRRVGIFDKTYGLRRFDMGICAGIAYEREKYNVGFEYCRGLHRLDPNFRQYNQTFDIVVGYRF